MNLSKECKEDKHKDCPVCQKVFDKGKEVASSLTISCECSCHAETLTSVIERVHNKLLQYRSMENYITQPTFRQVWNASTQEERDKYIKLIEDLNKDELKHLIDIHDSQEYGELSWKSLMYIAKEKRIPYYSRMSRLQLIAKLERRRRDESNGETRDKSIEATGEAERDSNSQGPLGASREDDVQSDADSSNTQKERSSQ